MLRWERFVSMAVAHIRRHVNATTVEIVFHYKNPELNIDRAFNLQRNISETIQSSLQRIKTNVEKEHNKKLNKKKKLKKSETSTEASSAEASVDSTSTEVDLLIEKNELTTWLDLLENVDEHEFKGTKLKVFGQEFSVAYNYPYVSQITMPTVILVGFDCYPAKFEVAFTERDKCIFEWYRGLPTESKNDATIEWNKCQADGFFYRVQPSDLRHKLKVNFNIKVCKNATKNKLYFHFSLFVVQSLRQKKAQWSKLHRIVWSKPVPATMHLK